MSKVYVGFSQIHGKGVFAAIDIEEGTQILKLDDSRVVTDDNPLQAEKGEYEHHCDYIENGKVVLMQEPERYINRSCDPNVYVKAISGTRYVYAMRNIKAGEELTLITVLMAMATASGNATVVVQIVEKRFILTSSIFPRRSNSNIYRF